VKAPPFQLLRGTRPTDDTLATLLPVVPLTLMMSSMQELLERLLKIVF
jgi:hypothetical protein